MKTRFDTLDLVCSVAELQRLIGMRVNQIYDIDHKTYLIRLQRSEEKAVLLIESGNRIHTTAFEWPKNTAPSGFSMKMRKHLKNKRLESLTQLANDRIIDLQFGSGEAAYHIILELYDRGNIVLVDHTYTTLNILRPHTDSDKIRFAVKEKYPLSLAQTTPTLSSLTSKLSSSKPGDSLKKALTPLLPFGPALIDHLLLSLNFPQNSKIGGNFSIEEDSSLKKLEELLNLGEFILEESKKSSRGFIIQKKEVKPTPSPSPPEFITTNVDFHPILLKQFKNSCFKEFESFDAAVDDYFSSMEGQKLELKVLAQEKEALKKLENVRKDHDQRLEGLDKIQEMDEKKGELITRNQLLVDNAILAIQSAVANQLSWPDIKSLLNEAKNRGDSVARAIRELKLEKNHILMGLEDPYEGEGGDLEPMMVEVDLGLSAFANARKYYNLKRSAAKKQMKTLESHGKALKSAEKKTKQTLKEVQAIHVINKSRKVYWFEKFYWFVTSENYLVIGGRDQQQNEVIVKRYLRPGDLYVHADLTGASSVVLKNPTGDPVPPKSLAEAGTFAVAYSVAWEAKVVAGAWWVHHDQVSKTAPTGEYLTTGSFMIRGKKNYLPACQLIMGFGFLFRLEEGSVERHLGERRVRTVDEENPIEEKEIINEELEEIEEDSEEESVFPDTKIKIDVTGSRIKVVVDRGGDEDLIFRKNKFFEDFDEKKEEKIEEIDGQIDIDHSGSKVKMGIDRSGFEDSISKKSAVYRDPPIPAPIIPTSRRPSTTEKDGKSEEKRKESVLKRGQKGRLKKMKEKYKDQDEEDRKLLMEVLKPDGAAKEDKRKKNKNALGQKIQGKKGNPKVPVVQKVQVDDDEDVGPAPEVDMLEGLTGKPVEEDELLFAVPVIAPYNTLLNYKFKVKLMPGTGRRGKAAKTAISAFLRDKAITPRERDLLKAVREETVARNIPGKVKISAPQMQKGKK